MDNKCKITNDNYSDYVQLVSPKSAHFKNTAIAFIVGGLICVVGQLFIELYLHLGATQTDASTYASCSIVALAALATGLGIYDKLGRFAGAGSTIPISGFSNAVAAPTLEFKSEGLIYGLGAKMFTVAGPVIANGVLVSTLIALILMLFRG